MKLTKNEVINEIRRRLDTEYGVNPENATDDQYYRAAAAYLNDIIAQTRAEFNDKCGKQGVKRINYLCMEFLLGRSLKNSLYNLGLTGVFDAALSELGVKLSAIYECEPDAGLGNGGLGRLAACFMDSMASLGYAATGYSILYEYGIFRQKLVDGWQTELPDDWLPGGEVWLTPRPDEQVEVRFDGTVNDYWDEQGYRHQNYTGYHSVLAVPHDLMMVGNGGKGVAVLRLWSAVAKGFDMKAFNNGDFMSAMQQSGMAEVISKVLYPSDNLPEGKSLRLRQQYFLVSASLQDIVKKHISERHPVDALPEKAAIHINDTHPALAIPELMRILMDDCGYGWDTAMSITERTVAYTNHTVMGEALETWPEDLFRQRLPRMHQIVTEINRRYCAKLWAEKPDFDRVSRMAIISHGQVRMANLCCAVCHSVNGVSKLHTAILRDSLFKDFYQDHPERFRNVTNGIAYRRWLCQANPRLTGLISDLIGDGFKTDAHRLTDLAPYARDEGVLKRLYDIKRANKLDFSNLAAKSGLRPLNPDSIFDVQVKRLHEYKRQHMNALHVLSRYIWIKEHPNEDVTPQTFLFGAKAAPGYQTAKEIICLISAISRLCEFDPAVRDKLRVVFLEDYRVTMAEALMPAADVSEQISLAGTEASGTGNMKLMLNGAVTIGTMDGANVEIYQAVGAENILIFGMNAEEAAAKRTDYNPAELVKNDPELRALTDILKKGICDCTFSNLYDNLVNRDPYMVLADFAAYKEAQARMRAVYDDRMRFMRMSLMNIAKAGRFSSDRSIERYAADIWGAKPIK